MIIRRIAEALRRQDWTVVFIEFVLVVAGVLIALEVDRYNEQQKEIAEEVEFLKLLRQDLRQDIADIEALSTTYGQIQRLAGDTIALLNADGCATDCWRKIVAAFHASQWQDVSLNTSIYEEMRRRGLPSDADLKSRLINHYNLAEQRKYAMGELPRYRELIRSTIPPEIQQDMWSRCFRLEGKTQYFLEDCETQISEEAARELVLTLQANTELKPSLTFWLSNVALILGTFTTAVTEANEAIDIVSAAIPE